MTRRKLAEVLGDFHKNDPDFRREQAKSNCTAAITCAGVAAGIGVAGLVGSYIETVPDSFDLIPSWLVYTLIIFLNLPIVLTGRRVLKKYGTDRPRKANGIFCNELLLTQLTACFSIFSTQEGSSPYIEALLILFPIAILSAFPLYRYIIDYIVIGLVLHGLIRVTGIQIAWQDSYDLIIFLILCFFLSVKRHQWFLQRYQANQALRQANEDLFIKSRTDELTGAANQNAFADDLSSLVDQDSCAALVDIDSFRQYNDMLGNAGGDRLLKKLAKEITSVFAMSNARFYRYAGDEFLITVHHMGKDEFASHLKALQAAFAANNLSSTVTIGYCSGHPKNERDIRTLVSAADKALYEAKDRARGGMLEGSFSGAVKDTSDIDPLTGALTADGLIRRMNERILTEDMYVLFLDLDRFQQLNKEFGFRTGDRVLKDMVEWLTKEFPGDLCSRENDHFAVLTERADYETRLRRIQQRLSAFDGNIYIRLRAGIYNIQEKGASLGARACIDMAKYASDSLRGRTGIGLQVFDAEMDKARDMKAFVQNHFSEAIEKGYIIPYYQPIIASLSGVCAGFEALARWIDPEKGFLSPGVFVPVLEESHESYFLDFHILKKVCEMLSKQDVTAWGKFVSVNFSRTDFEAVDLPARIDSIVSSYGIPRDMLRIEVTESAFSDSPQIRTDIKRLEDMGYLVWLDDFGSGMSSLNTMKNFHVNAAKIDLEFLRDSDKNPKAFQILKQMIRLCHSIDTIALVEGVETKEQLEFVRQCGGNLIQGYFYSRPEDLSSRGLEKFRNESISKEEYDYYARAAFMDIDKSPDVIFDGTVMTDVSFQIEKDGDDLIYLRVSSGARQWADKFDFKIEQRGPVYLGNGDFNRSVRTAIDDAIRNEHEAFVSMPLPNGTSCWLCIKIISTLVGTDRCIIMASIVNKIHPTV